MTPTPAGGIDIGEQERRRRARDELATKLSGVLQFALSRGLTSEASMITKLIDATIQNKTIELVMKLNKST